MAAEPVVLEVPIAKALRVEFAAEAARRHMTERRLAAHAVLIFLADCRRRRREGEREAP